MYPQKKSKCASLDLDFWIFTKLYILCISHPESEEVLEFQQALFPWREQHHLQWCRSFSLQKWGLSEIDILKIRKNTSRTVCLASGEGSNWVRAAAVRTFCSSYPSFTSGGIFVTIVEWRTTFRATCVPEVFPVKAIFFSWVNFFAKKVDSFMLACDVEDWATPHWDSEVGGFNYSAAVVQPLQSCEMSKLWLNLKSQELIVLKRWVRLKLDPEKRGDWVENEKKSSAEGEETEVLDWIWILKRRNLVENVKKLGGEWEKSWRRGGDALRGLIGSNSCPTRWNISPPR